MPDDKYKRGKTTWSPTRGTHIDKSSKKKDKKSYNFGAGREQAERKLSDMQAAAEESNRQAQGRKKEKKKDARKKALQSISNKGLGSGKPPQGL